MFFFDKHTFKLKNSVKETRSCDKLVLIRKKTAIPSVIYGVIPEAQLNRLCFLFFYLKLAMYPLWERLKISVVSAPATSGDQRWL